MTDGQSETARPTRRKRTENLDAGPRTDRIVVKVSAAEKHAITARAEASGVTAARFLRETAMAE
ncbi:plasmid mobilization protein, partial [Streptomyces sp. NPDC058657]